MTFFTYANNIRDARSSTHEKRPTIATVPRLIRRTLSILRKFKSRGGRGGAPGRCLGLGAWAGGGLVGAFLWVCGGPGGRDTQISPEGRWVAPERRWHHSLRQRWGIRGIREPVRIKERVEDAERAVAKDGNQLFKRVCARCMRKEKEKTREPRGRTTATGDGKYPKQNAPSFLFPRYPSEGA